MSNMKQIILIFGFLVSQVHAQTAWKVETALVTFEVKNAGLNVKGTLGDFKGDIIFDRKNLTHASMKGTVNVSTIKTGIGVRDKHLQSEEYFNANAFPTIQLVSSFFGKSEDGYRAYFKLTMKGITKDVMIPIVWVEDGKNATVSGSFKLNRLDFGIGKKSLILNNDINVYIELKLKRP